MAQEGYRKVMRGMRGSKCEDWKGVTRSVRQEQSEAGAGADRHAISIYRTSATMRCTSKCSRQNDGDG